MRRMHLDGVVVLLTGLIVFPGASQAGTQTYVALAGRDDGQPRLGRPAISVHVVAPIESDAAAVMRELSRELAEQVHTRRLAQDEPGDYDLVVTLDDARVDDAAATVPFEAVLTSARGERLWRVEGRADVEAAPLDASVYVGIGRNVISALIHDGWLSARYDPDNPPPQPPRLR